MYQLINSDFLPSFTKSNCVLLKSPSDAYIHICMHTFALRVFHCVLKSVSKRYLPLVERMPKNVICTTVAPSTDKKGDQRQSIITKL